MFEHAAQPLGLVHGPALGQCGPREDVAEFLDVQAGF
jgi:hypothetical protein